VLIGMGACNWEKKKIRGGETKEGRKRELEIVCLAF